MSPHRPRKRFGQHFLRDSGVIAAIVDAVAPAAADTIVEIGPGQGAITAPLAARAGRVHAIELDRDLAARLRRDFASAGNVTIHAADALRFDYPALGTGLRVVGNLPYNVSTPLLFALIGSREHIADMHFMLQKEVVDRITAAPGSKAYGRLGIMLGCRFRSEPLFDVEPGAFDPPPEVVSSVVRLEPLPAGTYAIRDERQLSRLVAQAFSQRRKTLRNSLAGLVDAGTLESLGIDPRLRAEAIPVADFVRLANTLE